MEKLENIKVEDYRGLWYVIDEDMGYLLLEHQTYGDETCHLVVKKNDYYYKKFQLRDGDEVELRVYRNAYETFDDIETCLSDEGII